MYEDLRSSTVFSPETMGELVNFKEKNPNAVFWAGGTYLMSKVMAYPSKEALDIISLDKISELKRINRNDSSVDFGSMVTLQNFALASKAFFSEDICKALSSIGTQIIRAQATIGGALCTNLIKTSFSAIMSTLDATVECRIIGKRSFVKMLPVEKMFDKSGNLTLSPTTLVTRLHVNINKDSLFFFKNTGSPLTRAEESVTCAIRCKMIQNTIVETRTCFVFPLVGLHTSEVLQSSLTGVVLPMNPVRIMKLTESLVEEIKHEHPGLKPIQVEQASRIFESFIYDLNAQIIARS